MPSTEHFEIDVLLTFVDIGKETPEDEFEKDPDIDIDYEGGKKREEAYKEERDRDKIYDTMTKVYSLKNPDSINNGYKFTLELLIQRLEKFGFTYKIKE